MTDSNQTTAIVPFWNRLPAIMRYPAQGGAIAAIVLLGAAQVLRMLPFGWILAMLAGVAMYRYAFECLRSTAEGYMQAPEVGLGEDRSLGWKFVWLIVILVLIILLSARLLGPNAALVIALAIATCMPAATMTLAMQESLVEALNPLKWVAIIGTIGWPYLALVGVCVAIFMSEGWAQQAVAHVLPRPLALIGLGIISNYAVVALFHLMGYVLYQFHEAFGLAVEAQPLARPGAPRDPDQDKLDQSAALVRDGKLQDAIDLLGEQVRRGGTPALHAQFRKLLRAANNTSALLAHGRDYVAVLIDQDDARTAVEVLRECQALDPAFAPETAAHTTRLAQMAAHLGQPQAALQLLSGFGERFPASQYLAANALLGAELLHEKLGQDEQARDMLLAFKAIRPSDPLMPEIDARLAAIQRMIDATATKPARQGGNPGPA